jgi:SAM-dependent methyltransferase
MGEEWLSTNQAYWDERAPLHTATDFYDVPRFKAGATSLRPFEIAEMGDVTGRRLLHLQCHFGLDTLSWARLGATVTGLDFAPSAVAAARALAAEIGVAGARFVQSNVYDAPAALGERYDIVYTGTFDEPGSYADWDLPTVHNRATLWRHGLGTIVSAICAAGLRIEFLHEHDMTLFSTFYNLVRRDDGTWHRPEGLPRLPMMFSLRATS